MSWLLGRVISLPSYGTAFICGLSFIQLGSGHSRSSEPGTLVCRVVVLLMQAVILSCFGAFRSPAYQCSQPVLKTNYASRSRVRGIVCFTYDTTCYATFALWSVSLGNTHPGCLLVTGRSSLQLALELSIRGLALRTGGQLLELYGDTEALLTGPFQVL